MQFTNGETPVHNLCEQILALRKNRGKAGNKKKFDRETLRASEARYGYGKGTPSDYADTNFRYLKATGLFMSSGRNICLVEHRSAYAESITRLVIPPTENDTYIEWLTNGSPLPDDDRERVLQEWEYLRDQLNKCAIPYRFNPKPDDDIAQIRSACVHADDLLTKHREIVYARDQKSVWSDISEIMGSLCKSRRPERMAGGLRITSSERPAYLEWVLWRAFLAINHLVIQPFDARRFPVDVDFLPVTTAPGNCPDMIFEFLDFVLVVEATLTESSRQEAWEGEPVRRHVAQCVSRYCNKQVYGLFVAIKVDTNTVETFRQGSWYGLDDSHIRLNIVPVSLSIFERFFRSSFVRGGVIPEQVREFLDACLNMRDTVTAPEWKAKIEQIALKSNLAI